MKANHRPLRRLRHAAEYAVFRALVTVVLAMRLKTALAIGEWIGRLFCRLKTSRTRVARENLATAFPAASPETRERILEESFAHFGRLVVEILRIPRDVRKENWRSFAEYPNMDRLVQVREAGRAVILVGAHLGNWELAAHTATLAGLPLLSIARPIENERMEEYFARVRALSGQRTVPKHGGMRVVVSEMRRQRGVLGVLVDQNARKAGVFVPYFGRLASTTPTPAHLAIRHGAVILPFTSLRQGRGFHYRVLFDEPLSPRTDLPEEEAVLDLTRRYTQVVEEAVRAHPGQYLWMHRRWKTRPPSDQSPSLPGRSS